MLTAVMISAVAVASAVAALAVAWYGMTVTMRVIAFGSRRSRRDV